MREWDDCVRHGERWLEGTFFRRARAMGNDIGYDSIVAGGHHATTLHWIDNSGPITPGELVLLDMGVEGHHLYTADVTRTLPVDGRFTDLQRELYDLVLASQEAALAVVRPGVKFRDPHDAAMVVLAHGLDRMGLLPVSVDEALSPDSKVYSRWTLHGVSHMLGMDVHDCGRASDEAYTQGTLAEGMCLTVEPGLYFQQDDLLVPEELRGIGIRIEDDVMVTADGHRQPLGLAPAHRRATSRTGWRAPAADPARWSSRARTALVPRPGWSGPVAQFSTFPQETVDLTVTLRARPTVRDPCDDRKPRAAPVGAADHPARPWPSRRRPLPAVAGSPA